MCAVGGGSVVQMNKPSKEKKWKSFEKLVYEIQSALSPKAKVTPNDFILGVESGKKRQIDISVRENVGQFEILVILECRDLARPVDLPQVEAFVQKVRDVRANKGAVVSARGFTDGAMQLANHHCIDVFGAIDTKSTDWKTYVSLPSLLIRHFIKSVSFVFSDFDRVHISLTNPRVVLDAVAFDKGHKRIGKIKYLIAKQWNSGKLPPEDGIHGLLLSGCRFIEHEGEIYEGRITANIEVGTQRFLGPWPVDEARGFSDAQDGSLITRELTMDSLEPYKIETGQVPGWVCLEPNQEPSIQPVVILNYQDHRPESAAEEKSPANEPENS